MLISIILLLGLLLPLALITVGVVSFMRKRQDHVPTNETEVEDTIRTIYLYLVLLATLLMSIGGSVAVFMSVADFVAPTSGYIQSYSDFSSEYVRRAELEANRGSDPYNNDYKEPTGVTKEEMKKEYEEMVAQRKQQNKEEALNSLVKAFGWIVIPLPIFLVYSRKVKNPLNKVLGKESDA